MTTDDRLLLLQVDQLMAPLLLLNDHQALLILILNLYYQTPSPALSPSPTPALTPSPAASRSHSTPRYLPAAATRAPTADAPPTTGALVHVDCVTRASTRSAGAHHSHLHHQSDMI